MSFDPERITFFAKTDARGKDTPFGIKAIDRTKHVYVIGKTGMGKSTLLENMAVQDIKNGEGFAFIDPHGQTAETLLDYIPEERKNDVLYFAPFDAEHPVAFNVMEDVGPDKRHLVVSGLMSVFKKIWVDAWSARMEYILQNTLLALLEYPDSTLLGVNRMLSEKVYRKKVIDNISDPAVKSFWVDEFLNYNERYMQEAGDSIKNKIGQFTANPLIRNIIGQPKSSFNLRQMMDERKILIVNLSKGLIGESNANLLGSMLTTRIYLAAMSRADLEAQEMKTRPNFYFYVDEFQSFANATFADILSEARKYKLNLTIAHQYIEQMEEDVRNAVFGNVGTIVSFRVGPFDAEVLETIFAPQFTATDIVNLGFAQIYLTLMIDGIGSPPFSAVTLPPIQHEGISCKRMVIHNSREQFSFPRPKVEEAINAWHAPLEEERPPRKTASGSGNNNSNANGGGRSSPNNTNNRRDDRPPRRHDGGGDGSRPPRATQTKSLDELRDVLKNISDGSGAQKAETKPANSSKSKESAPQEVRNTTESVPKAKPDNKRKPEINLKKDVVTTKHTADASPLKSALADALKDVQPPQSKPPPANTDSTTQRAAVTPPKEVAPAATKSIKKENDKQEMVAVMKEIDSLEAEVVLPASAASTTDDPLDPKKIKKMIRTPNGGRTPF